MKRHLLLLAAALIMGATAQAQNAYDETHHYDLVSHCEIGLTAQYTRNFTQGPGDVGAFLHVTKRIGTHSRFRVVGGVDGFLKNGFDRKGFAMMGFSADFRPFYMFLDGGVSINPSASQTVNPAAEGGIGFNFNIGRNLRMMLEAGADITSTGQNNFTPNGFVRFGYAYSTGITNDDYTQLSMERNREALVVELREENALLKSETKRQEEANRQLQQTLDRATAACEAVEKLYKDCKETVKSNPNESVLTLYFDYASSELNETASEQLRHFALTVMDTSDEYRIEGFASADGDPNRNQRLSEQRAYAAYYELVIWGVDPDRLSPSGNGVGSVYEVDSPLNRMVRITKSSR